MNIEAEVKEAVQTVTGEVKTVEAAVEGTVAAAKGEVKSVAEAVKAEVVKTKEAILQITSEEKLFLREAELEFLKAQMEIKRLSELAESKSKSYTSFVEQLFTKYGVTKAEYVFDGTTNVLKKL